MQSCRAEFNCKNVLQDALTLDRKGHALIEAGNFEYMTVFMSKFHSKSDDL